MNNTIQFVEQIFGTPKTHYLENVFEYRKDRGWKWLQKLCFAFLRWNQCFYLQTVETKQLVIRDDANKSVLDRIFQQSHSILLQFNREPTEVLIGAKDYAELMGCAETHHLIEFGQQYQKPNRVLGLNIKIVPWMKGILVMP